MKRILLIIAILLCASTGWAATYYGCATGVDIAADNTFCTTPTGSCTGETAVTGATAIASGNVLYANGCAEITTDNGFNIGTGTISTADGDGAGAAVAGGAFTFTTTNDGAKTITANINGGTTSGLAIDGSGTGTVLTITGNITGGTGSSAGGITDTRTAGTIAIVGNITGGGGITGHGYLKSADGGTLTVDGTATGSATCNGLQSAQYFTAVTIKNCVAGGASGVLGTGCSGNLYGGIMTITGNIVDSIYGPGANGRHIWQPATNKNYIRKVTNTTGPVYIYMAAGLSSDSDGTKITAADTAAEISTGTYFVKSDDYNGSTLTQGTSSSSGGGASAW